MQALRAMSEAAAVRATTDGAILRSAIVADDDDWIRERVSENLRSHGFQVTALKDGRALCALIDHWAAAGEIPFQLVISDLSMPGASGLEALRHLRRRGLDVPFVLMSGFISDEERETARRLGVTAVLDKPFDLGVLRRALTDVVRGSASR